MAWHWHRKVMFRFPPNLGRGAAGIVARNKFRRLSCVYGFNPCKKRRRVVHATCKWKGGNSGNMFSNLILNLSMPQPSKTKPQSDPDSSPDPPNITKPCLSNRQFLAVVLLPDLAKAVAEGRPARPQVGLLIVQHNYRQCQGHRATNYLCTGVCNATSKCQ